MTTAVRTIRAPRGTTLSCKGWPQEAALRMLMNNLDPDVAERPEDLVVYGGTGRAARSWAAYDAIVASLRALEADETLLVQSGKPVGVFRTHADAPRVLIANANLVPAWATWETFRDLEDRGLTMYGQMTAGLGGMGGAQPLAVTMNEGVALVVEVDRSRIARRLATRYLDEATDSLDVALARCAEWTAGRVARSIGLCANAAEVLPALVARGVVPDVVTEQTSAHDALGGYVPDGLSLDQAAALRASDPRDYEARSVAAMGRHVAAMLALKRRGAVTFDYGNNIRAQAVRAGVADAFEIPGFVPEFVRPLFCEGKGPFRWAVLSGDPADLAATDAAALEMFAADAALARWIRLAQQRVAFQGLPARIFWLGYGDRARFGLKLNQLVRDGIVSAPIVIGRDHLDAGSVASPNRETEGMRDGSDAIADWPLLNALLNTAAGATWVSLHHGGGVGIGYSIHAGMVVVADGTPEADRRLERVLTCDPGMGVIRHVDAGYPEARAAAHARGVRVPMERSAS